MNASVQKLKKKIEGILRGKFSDSSLVTGEESSGFIGAAYMYVCIASDILLLCLDRR
jgi:hypothetical protein